MSNIQEIKSTVMFLEHPEYSEILNSFADFSANL